MSTEALTFAQMIEQPSTLKTGVAHLPDGRAFVIHELTCGALAEIGRITKKAVEDGESDIDVRDVATVAARALLGRDPSTKDVKSLMDRYSEQTIVKIYKVAIRFSKMGEEGLEEAKKN